ncbi:bacteriocin [Hydrotalea sandarakina]|jgi:bacteriocin-like protein|uniref:Bacteriocin-like protein n=1 Tax=Hydrotalea sandarakina TaxID=1004304 RepID=A0A2W7REZ5_9BACT|nr:bacteriocin [Hydrotalea sandarakina]PZX59483.1 bacteriocin-like protein [Hydrotalea sandarakina]
MKQLTKEEMKQIKGGSDSCNQECPAGSGRVQLAQLLRALQVHAQELYVIRNRYLIIIMHVPKI